MSTLRPDWDTLNAYVDGELEPARQAEVAEALARDPKLARKVATVTRLKQAVRDNGETDMDARPPIDLTGAWGPARRIAAVAAAVLLGVALGGIAGQWEGDAPPQWQADAQALHRDWANATDVDASASATSALLLAATADFGSPPFVPDLTAGKLTLARITRAQIGDSAALHLGYTGTRGCRVSMMVLASPEGLPGQFTRRSGPEGTGYAWQVGGLGYVLQGAGMGEARLDGLAEAAYAATLQNRQPDDETRTALRRKRASSPPCA